MLLKIDCGKEKYCLFKVIYGIFELNNIKLQRLADWKLNKGERTKKSLKVSVLVAPEGGKQFN